MKVGFDAKRAFYNSTGLGSYSRTAIKVLKKYYSDLDLFFFVPKSRRKMYFIDYQKYGYTIWSKGNKNLWRSLGICREASFRQLDIYHGLSAEIPFCKSAKVKFVVTIHDLIFWKFPKFYSPIDVFIYTQKAKYAIANSDIVIAISQSTKRDILEFMPKVNSEKIVVVYQSFNPIFYERLDVEVRERILAKYGLPREEFILYVGTIEERKNVLLLLEAAQRLKLDIPIVLVGRYRGRYGKLVREFISNSRLKVWVITNVLFEDLPAIYQNAMVFVYPSVYEGFGIPVIEAQQSGVPVITSNVSSLPEAAGPHSILINPYSVDEMKEALMRVLSDTQLRSRMITQGLEYVKRFSDRNFADGLYSVYNRVLD